MERKQARPRVALGPRENGSASSPYSLPSWGSGRALTTWQLLSAIPLAIWAKDDEGARVPEVPDRSWRRRSAVGTRVMKRR